MEIKINEPVFKLTFCYDNIFYLTMFEKSPLTLANAAIIMQSDMRYYGFTNGVATDADTGEVMIEIENKKD